MQDAESWFVKNEDGKVFGPIDLTTLVGWARDGRIAPTAQVSSDRAAWVLASAKPELDMTWLAEVAPRQFYGPVPAAVLDDLVKAGSLAATARRFHFDRGEAAEKITRLEGEVAARDAALAEFPRHAAEQAAATKKTLDVLESRLAKLHEESDKAAADAAAKVAAAEKDATEARRALEVRDNDLAALRASLDAAEEKAHAAESALAAAQADFSAREAIWKNERETLEVERTSLRSEQSTLQSEMSRTERSTASQNERLARLEQELAAAKAQLVAKAEVVEPEVIVSSAPPPRAEPHPASAAASLAELERQAQSELARMGAAGHKGFFGRKH